MKSIFAVMWRDVIALLFRRPPLRQVAALCWRDSPAGAEVLLVTSRGTGRWILPKGWPEDGLDALETALREAWEEAGVRRAAPRHAPVGHFDSIKTSDAGLDEPCRVTVYAAKVQELSSDYPESDARERRWVPLQEAAGMVQEPGLSAILRNFDPSRAKS